MSKRSLGRGLSDLLAGVSAVPSRAVVDIEVEKLQANPLQPRRDMKEDGLAELAHSIRELGILQPLLVREDDDSYQIVAGERRWRAAQIAGLVTVPCIVHQFEDRESLQVALIENVQREDLNPMDQARAYRRLIEDFGMTQEQIAERVGKSRSAVANCLRLLVLPMEVQEALREGVITEGHARTLIALKSSPGLLYEAYEAVVAEGLNVRQTESLAQALLEQAIFPERQAAPSPADPDPDPFLGAAVERLRQALATRVSIKPRARGGGTIRISYHDPEELSRLLDALAPELDL